MRLEMTKVALATGVGMLGAGAAVATDIRVNVTGTNIKLVDTETAAPIEVITREDIQASGLQTIQDVVRQITANNNGSISPSFSAGFSASGTAVSLRGLGPSNTLVLLNGRRLANFGLADDGHASYVDLSQIPFDAVERIEVLKDGASAIYGSDAVAGVVNVILRQQYTGFTVTATAGTTQNGEGSQVKGAITGGLGDLTKDRYNVFVTLDAQKQEANPANQGRQYIGTNDLRFMGLFDNRPGNPTLGLGRTYNGSLLGNVQPVAASNPAGPAGPFRSLAGDCAPASQDGGFCRWDPKDYVDLSPEIERFNAFARGTYAVTDATMAYAELSYFDVRTDYRLAPPATMASWYDPATLSVRTSNTISLPVGHPDNPYSAANQVARLSYADTGVGARARSYDTATQRYLLGIKGTTHAWDWDVAALYLRSDTDIDARGYYSYSRLQQGLAGTGPYGFYRVGASTGANDPAVYDWIAPARSWRVSSDNTVVDAKATRDLYQLGGGELALAVGYEFRRESVDNPGMPGTDVGDVVGIGYSAASGSRNVNAVYVELYAPLLRNLEATAALRYDRYSDVGGTTNPKLGVKWTIVPSLVIRGTWQTSFRAPGLYEVDSTTAAFGFGQDPVRCPVTEAVADCRALLLGIITPNANLQPETSTAYTVGTVWEPVPGLSATLDYWNFVTKNQITVDVVRDASGAPAIVRDTNDLPGVPNSGSILYVLTQYANAQRVKTDGIDLDVAWKLSLGDRGTLTTHVQWTHVFDYSVTDPDGVTHSYQGTQGPTGVSSSAGTPADRANFIVGWTRGPLSVTGTVRYVGPYQSVEYRGAQEEMGCISALDGPDCHVPSFTTLDLAASYSGFRNWQIFGSIINVFNRIAPFNPAAGGQWTNYNYNYAFPGATGTQFNLGFRYTF